MNPYLPRAMTIRSAVRESSDTTSFELDASAGGGLSFSPGQFNMVYVHGVGEVPISISGDPATPERLLHTVRAVGAVTRVMDRLDAGQTLGVRGPYGRGWPLEAARGTDVVFVAGGLGLAPLRGAILGVLGRRDEYGRVIILYGARTPADMIFKDDLARWRGRFDCTVEAIVDRADRSWRGKVGVVTRLIQEASLDEETTTAMICGPEVMMRFCARELVRRGVGPSNVYVSMERSMKCGVALCGHCQWGPGFVCKDGPVYTFAEAERLLAIREV